MRRLCASALIVLSFAFATPAGAADDTGASPARDGSELSAHEAAASYLVPGMPIPPLNSSLVRLEALRKSIGGEHRIARLRDALDEEVDTFEYSYMAGVHDITGDGAADVMIVRGRDTVTIDQDDSGVPTFSFDSKTTYSARHGRTGRELWNITEKAQDGYSWLVDGRLGSGAVAGFFLVKDQGWSTSQPWVELSGLSGRNARLLWEQRLDSTAVSDPSYTLPVTMTKDAPWITGLGNFLPGKADDLLVGLVTHASVGYYSTIYDTGVLMIDGQDGSTIEHAARERALDWIPLPWALGDQDDDGLRDYAFGNNIGAVARPGEPGEPPKTELGGVMRLRKGTNGNVIWEEGGLDLGQFAWASSVGNQFGGYLPEFFISVFDFELELLELPVPAPMPLPIGIGGITKWRDLTYVVDGGGRVRFWKPMMLFHAPGLIDRDREGDFLGVRFPFAKRPTIRLFAFNSRGKSLWTRTHRSPAPDTLCRDLCFSFTFIGLGGAGDLQPDGGKDLGVYIESEQGEARMFHHYTVDGLTGRMLHEGGEELFAPAVSFDRHGADLIEIYRKNGSVDVRTRQGTNGSTLNEATIGSDLPAIKRDDLWFDFGDVTADGCSDMLFTIQSTGGTYAVVLDGGSGKALWTEVLQGPDRQIVTQPTTDLNAAC